MEGWLSSSRLPSAILCASDYYAFAFIDAARKLGVAIPEELSIMGIDDYEPCEYVTPRLTSVRQPLEGMSAFCVELLTKALNGNGAEASSASTHCFDVDLITRDSCAPPRGHA